MWNALYVVLLAIAVGCGSVSTPGDAGPSSTETSVTVAPMLRVRQDGSAILDLSVTRASNAGVLYSAPIDVALVGLPTGVTATSTQIPATAGSLTVRAAATAAPLGPLTVTLRVTAERVIDVPVRLYVAGASGAADTGFSGDGAASVDSGVPTGNHDPRDVVVDRAGRTVVASVVETVVPRQGQLHRLTNDGVNDVAFGTAGRATPAVESVERVVVRPEGGYLALVYVNGSYAVQRLDDAGALVGTAVVSSVSTTPRTMIPLTDGALVVDSLVAEKYTYDGALDTRFGTGGKLSSNTLRGPAIDSRGRILGAGPFQVGRLLSSGDPDTSFSITFPVPAGHETPEGAAIAVAPDDGGYFCGAVRVKPAMGTSTALDRIPVLGRFRADGTIDTGFGTGGLVPILGTTRGICTDVVRLRDGRLLVHGGIPMGSGLIERQLWMVNPDGSLDRSFATAGVLIPPNGELGAMWVDEGERVVVIGIRDATRLFVTRYWL